jgi:hypothetical protein
MITSCKKFVTLKSNLDCISNGIKKYLLINSDWIFNNLIDPINQYQRICFKK